MHRNGHRERNVNLGEWREEQAEEKDGVGAHEVIAMALVLMKTVLLVMMIMMTHYLRPVICVLLGR